jgi:hypothetical protein
LDKYTNAELVGFLFTAVSIMDTQFQYWITVTFAALASAFVMGSKLPLATRVWAAALYVLASVILAIRFVSAAETTARIQSALEHANAALGGDINISLLRLPLFILGTASAVFFLVRPPIRKKAQQFG